MVDSEGDGSHLELRAEICDHNLRIKMGKK